MGNRMGFIGVLHAQWLDAFAFKDLIVVEKYNYTFYIAEMNPCVVIG